MPAWPFYFGQPFGGRFTFKALSMAATQSPSIFRRSGSGPLIVVAGLLSGFLRFVFFIMQSFSRNQPFSCRALDDCIRAFTVIQLAVIPTKVKFRKVAGQMLFANGVVNPHKAALD